MADWATPDKIRCPICGRVCYQDRNDFAWHARIEHARKEGEAYLEYYRRVSEIIPEKYRDVYETVTGEGKGPTGMLAAVCYIESKADMGIISEAFGTSNVTIKNRVKRCLNEGVVTLSEVRKNNYQNGYQKFAEDRNGGVNQHSV